MKYLYVNNKPNVIQLPGRDGKMVTFSKGQKKVLDDFFKRYVPKYLNVIKLINDDQPIDINRAKIQNNKTIAEQKKEINNSAVRKTIVKRIKDKPSGSIDIINSRIRRKLSKNIVGRGMTGSREATEFSIARIKENSIPISNNIGVGILSFNRLNSLILLIESIRKHTDLKKTTVFVSDESTDPKVWEWLKQQKDIVAFHNDRGGIAVNSNRLLRCLSRFKFKLILNDDVEVLKEGWDSFYFDKMNNNNIKHMCYYQNGVYGAVRPKSVNGIISISDKPHGAVLAIHDDAFKKVGYFDENFGKYGFEHVDYSLRINRSLHNNEYFFDAEGSEKYFKIHDDNSSDPNKSINYNLAKSYFNKIKNDKTRVWVDTSDKSSVPGISIVIPFRDIGRSKCVDLVIRNMKAQRFPEIQIIMVEQDNVQKMKKVDCVDYYFAKNDSAFCKSLAFNVGVFNSKFNNVILHDADMLVRSDYAILIDKHLNDYDSVHIGKTVCYMNESSTEDIILKNSIDESLISSDRIVNYYEGGSLAIKRNIYYEIGGFCEDFVGYGCEDTEFYNRMVKGSRSYTDRYVDLFHLWHGRTSGWEELHEKNKNIQSLMFKEDIEQLKNRLKKKLSKYGAWI